MNIEIDILNGSLIISDKFNITASASQIDATPYFTDINDEYILSFINIQNVSKLTKFTYETLGSTDRKFLETEYRISRNGINFSDWLSVSQDTFTNFPIIDPLDPLFIEMKWIRKGTNSIGNIRLLEYKIVGELQRDEAELGELVKVESGETKLIKPPFIYKVFRIDDIELISPTGTTFETNGVEFMWRYSQDNSRTWSSWELLTVENIKTKRLSPIRFFEVEFSVKNNTNSTISIQDINLVGDFQNVTLDYRKTNLYGIRECCQSNLYGTYDANGNFIPNENLNSNGSGSTGGAAGSGGGSCDGDGTGVFSQSSVEQIAQFYNPYQQNQAVQLLDKLSTDAEQIFGHKVIYFATDPDSKGFDYTLHEYQLYNVVKEAEIKVSVNNNEFPDSQVVMNQFDLNLFDTLEVHITKKQFKDVFGVQRRPSKEDFMYFCNINRLFQVDHAQQFRGFNNASVYYKLILKKYNKKANVIADTTDIKNRIDMLTQNSTIDSLFGFENNQDKNSIANKPQHKTLTIDPIRLDYVARIDRELIENSSTVISKSHYDMSSVEYGKVGVNYLNFKTNMLVSDNIGYIIWFNLNNYIQNEEYSLFKYYDDDNDIGWKVNLINDKVKVTLNSTVYDFDLSGNNTNGVIDLEEDVWYCYVLNLDQRNRSMSQYIYKRDTDNEEWASRLRNTALRKVYSNTQNIEAIEFDIENNNPKILGSDMKVTNIRLFSDIIPEDTHNKLLNQSIIGNDSRYLIFADNANTRLFLNKYPLFE